MTHPLSSAQPVGLHLTTAQSPTVDALLATGSAHLYNLDFEEATERFEHSLSVDPDHPGPYAWLAATLWLREMHDRGDLALDGVVDASTLRRDDEDDTARDGHRAAEDARRARLDEAVFRLVAEGLSRATAWTETVPHDLDGLYYRGLLVAIRAGYRAAVMDDTAGAHRRCERRRRVA